MITRGRANAVRKTGKTRPVAVGGICTPSAAASVGATSCCTAGIEYAPVLTAGPANMSGIATSYTHGEPCMYTTSGSGRVMMSPSRGTMRSWPVRPGKYARANMSRNRCRAARAAASADATRTVRGPPPPEDRSTCWPEIGQAIATRVRARRTAPQAVSLERDDKGSPRHHGTRLEEGVSDAPSALAGTIDACHWRPNGLRFSGKPSERSERPERKRGRRVRCNAMLGGWPITSAPGPGLLASRLRCDTRRSSIPHPVSRRLATGACADALCCRWPCPVRSLACR